MLGTKTDCFAYRPKGSTPCNALKGLYCKGGAPCPFYKTKEQAKADKIAAEKRYHKHTGQTAKEWLDAKIKQEAEDAQR